MWNSFRRCRKFPTYRGFRRAQTAAEGENSLASHQELVKDDGVLRCSFSVPQILAREAKQSGCRHIKIAQNKEVRISKQTQGLCFIIVIHGSINNVYSYGLSTVISTGSVSHMCEVLWVIWPFPVITTVRA
jgi:hypothetical protein